MRTFLFLFSSQKQKPGDVPIQDPAGRAVSTYVGLIGVVERILCTHLSEQYNSIVYLEIRSCSRFVGCWDQILVKQVVYVQECFL